MSTIFGGIIGGLPNRTRIALRGTDFSTCICVRACLAHSASGTAGRHCIIPCRAEGAVRRLGAACRLDVLARIAVNAVRCLGASHRVQVLADQAGDAGGLPCRLRVCSRVAVDAGVLSGR